MATHSNNNNNNGGVEGATLLSALFFIGHLVLVWYAGTIAWSWSTPQSFGGVIVFLFWWGTLITIGEIALTGLFMAIGSQLE